MAQPLDYVEYLTKEIGARPAGTEEEQQAAIYIADEFQKEAGFPAAIEEFTSSSNLEGGRAILSMITIVVSILAMLFHVLTVPALVLAVIAAVIYVMESYGHPVLSKGLSRGASQNVVAKYQPSLPQKQNGRNQRQRKIVLVAHYDTGKVTPGIVRRVRSLGLPLSKICLAGMVAAAFFLLLRIFIGGTGGAGLVFINILTIIAILVVALPIVNAILYRVAPYNEGANNNATGVAALLEVARRIGSGSVSEADLLAEGEDAVIHGQRAAEESGLVPEGAELRYELESEYHQAQIEEDEYEQASQEDRLLAAKAAIAALTGKPVDQHLYAPVSEERADVRSQDSRPVVAEAPAAAPAPSEAQPAGGEAAVVSAGAALASSAAEATGFQNAPSWFVAAQQNAKRSENSQPVQRSRYTEAIQAAERDFAERERAKQEEERQRRARELREREAATRAAISAMRADRQAMAEEVASVDAAAGALPAQAPQQVPDEPAIAETQLQLAVETPSMQAEAKAEPKLVQSDEAAVAEPAVVDELLALDDPGKFEDRLNVEVDLGQTIAFTPEMIRQAIQEELEEESREAEDKLQKQALDTVPDIALPQESAPTRPSLAGIPSVEQREEPSVPETTNPSRSGMFRMLRTDVPTLSTGEDQGEPASPSERRPLESAKLPKITLEEEPVASEETEAVDYDMELPVSEELAAAAGAYDAPAQDAQPVGEEQAELPEEAPADASAPETAEESADAPAPEKAKSRGGLLGRLRRKGEEELQDTPQEWLGVDEDFEAREVGRNRGSWESFRQDETPEEGRGDGSWQGGAFSRVRLGHVSTQSGEGEPADEAEELPEAPEDQQLNEEIEQIYHFRNPAYNAEIWFVAIGSDTELHDGAKAFAEAHKAELRGAMVIEVESLGLGALSVASEEGDLRKIQASSRIKRFTRGATEATGIVLDQVRLAADSVTTTLQSAGFQVMHIMGIEDGQPALKGSADDIMENVDELILEDNINYLMELLRQE